MSIYLFCPGHKGREGSQSFFGSGSGFVRLPYGIKSAMCFVNKVRGALIGATGIRRVCCGNSDFTLHLCSSGKVCFSIRVRRVFFAERRTRGTLGKIVGP